MWRISALDRDGREVGRFELAQGELTIGRDADRQLVLASASVSRRHARVYIDGGQPCIVDEGSANGVIVDGVRITQPTYLTASTRVDLAEFRIAVERMGAGASAQSAGASLPATMSPPFDSGPSGESALPMRLCAEGGPYDGRVFPITTAEIAVGRAVDNDIVLDDPSLSRKHAKLFRKGRSEIDVEDLGSSNGTFVNGRKVGRGMIRPGDLVRFGELTFRVEGDGGPGTHPVSADIPQQQLYLLIGAAATTVLLFLLMVVFLVRRPRPTQAPGRESIAKLTQKADLHRRQGRAFLDEKKYADAKAELDLATELDPANVETRRLRNLAVQAPEDDKRLTTANSKIGLGDKRGFENAIATFHEMTDGTPAQQRLAKRLPDELVRWGQAQCVQKSFADCAWALCRAFEVARDDNKPDGAAARMLRDAEKKVRDKTYKRCAAAP
jgi:pSer/pThr/pTyr-binding forkhead associated (FHA) protein